MKKHIRKVIICIVLMLSAAFMIEGASAAADGSETLYKSAADLSGKRIGVLTGTIFDRYGTDYIPGCEIFYYNSTADAAAALDEGFIDAYITDDPLAQYLIATHSNQAIIETIEKTDYAYIMEKDNAKTERLSSELNNFLRESRSNGLLDYLKNKWIGKYESVKTIDFSQVKDGENGIINFATSTDAGAPFSYLKDGAYVGYEVEIMVEFCKENGYGLKISNYSFSGLLSAVQSGNVDIGASCITVTEERKERFHFSDSNYYGGVVLVGIKAERASIVSLEELKGATVGILSGSFYDEVANENIEECSLSYYNSFSDIVEATNNHIVDCYITDEPVAKQIIANNPKQQIVVRLSDDSYGMIFKKDDAVGTELCNKMNAFLLKSKDNGFIKTLENKWIYGSDDEQCCDYSDLKSGGKNGTLVYATCTEVGAPFCYYKNGIIVGYEIELAAEFCREYGYNFEVKNYSFSGILSAVSSGSADFGGACIIITEERRENVLFADPHYKGGMVIVALNDDGSDTAGFLNSVKDSFDRTFIRENRWRLFLSGVGSTMIITVVSIICGAALGFLVFISCRKGRKITNAITRICFNLIQRMPVVVLLMILYYVIFGQLLSNALIVSTICFTLIFAASFFGIVSSGVNAIGKEQYEAAFSLGFSDTDTFMYIILPQAAQHFLPLLRSEVVTHIKATAVVGYIAVADLTRVSDIIRSRTYEAFFPLIATAVIYFALEGMLIFAVKRMELGADYKRRTPGKILRGIEQHEN